MNTNTAENIDVESAIDAAIAKAKARAASRGSSDEKVKMSPEERQQKQAELKAQREQRKAEREAKKSSSGPVHMRKVERAAAALPKLTEDAGTRFNDIVSNLPSDQVTALALHLQHHNRVISTQRAVGTGPLKVGQIVRITGGDPRFIGLSGALEKVQRIRCYVNLPTANKVLYCFTSDVELVLEQGESLPVEESTAEAVAV